MADSYTIIATRGSYTSDRTLFVDCSNLLNEGEKLVTDAGPPAYPAATTASGLTINATTVSTTEEVINGRTVAAYESVLIDVEATDAGTYTIAIFLKTDASTPQKPILEIELVVVA